MRLALVLLESSDLEESYRKTDIPQREFGVAEIQKQLMKGQAVIQMGPYRVHALSRSCRKPDDCTPWKKANVVWNDLNRQHPVPDGGEVFLRREANLTLLVKTDPVKVDGGTGRIVSTECALEFPAKGKNNGTCRKMWGPEADFKPIGHLWADATSPDLVATFTKTHLWIGAHTKRGGTESRFAIIVPYAEGVELNSDGAADGAWLHIPTSIGVPLPGQRTIYNGQEEFVWEVPMNSVDNEGRFASRQLVKHTLYAFTHAGIRRALRGYVVYDGDLETAGVTVKYLIKGKQQGNYAHVSDVDQLPLRTPVPSFPDFAKAAEIRLPFAVSDGRGDYEIEFDLRPAANRWARVHSLRVMMRTDRT